MARKHIIERYKEKEGLYLEMVNLLSQVSEDDISIESDFQLEQIQKVFNLVKNDFIFWSEVIYLLNLPNRPKKEKKYKKQDKKVTSFFSTIENNVKTSEEASLKTLRNFLTSISKKELTNEIEEKISIKANSEQGAEA